MRINKLKKKIMLLNNQIEDSKFGIYERCNFKLKLDEGLFSICLAFSEFKNCSNFVFS